MDYRQYCRQRLDLLRSGPHLRAALLHGGIIWRLAMEMAGEYSGNLDLLRSYLELGPSEESGCHRIIIQDGQTTYVDDGLSDYEVDAICGVNHVYTGKYTGVEEDQSWWPKPSIWSTSGMYTGIWTPKNEHWFCKRLGDIEAGNASPMNARKWRSAVGQYRQCGRLADTIDVASQDIIAEYLL
ncbi:hypothetical protein C8Q76DRAFT_611425 [Earliella scabrosa]|nr:hypothetical protein C8Q76DRAFT_611425 [Earliella scabrosa]